jgi:hypothetical protein
MGDWINPALAEALREMGRPTTPRQLHRRGVKRLRSVGMREVSLLIERSINRTLMERTLNGSAIETEELAARAQEDFARGVRVLQQLSDSQQAVREHRLRMEEQLQGLRSRLGMGRGFVETAASEAPRVTAELLGKLRACLAPLVAGESDPRSVDKVVGELAAIVQESLRIGLEVQRRAFEGDVQVLERRIKKLVESVEENERALERVSTEDVDLGVASVYRTVQGLTGEQDSSRKRELMSSLFQANLELRGKL